jgi:hypothetical protein
VRRYPHDVWLNLMLAMAATGGVLPGLRRVPTLPQPELKGVEHYPPVESPTKEALRAARARGRALQRKGRARR